MGCSATKNLAAVDASVVNSKVEKLSSPSKETRKVSVTQSVSDIPPLEGEDPQTEILENIVVNRIQKKINGLSFEVAFPNEQEESIIKKHPPKRFQRLEEQQIDNTASLVKLQEKLDEAEVRRQQILLQRVQSAKQKNFVKKQSSELLNNDENS